MDLDAFECPICLSLFQGSIFQCKNGHVVCDACHARIHGTCPSCREPVVDIRCWALENVIAGMALPCSFRSHGCTQLLKHAERQDHEAFLCLHVPFACPLHGCVFSGSGQLLYDHIWDAHTFFLDYVVCFAKSPWRVSLHRSRPFLVLLDPLERRVFLLLSGGDVRSGQSLSVVCLGPRPAAGQLLEYKLEVEVGAAGKPGAISLTASCSVPCMHSWAGQYPTDGFLFVPDAYWTSMNSVVVNVHVQKSTVNNAGTRFTTQHPRSEIVSPCPQVNAYRWIRHPSLGTFDPLLVLLVFVFFTTMAVMLALAWKTSSPPVPETVPSSTPSLPIRMTAWDVFWSNFVKFD